MAIGIVSLIVVVVVVLIAIPVLSAVFGRATRQDPNDTDNEEARKKERGRRSGHGGRN